MTATTDIAIGATHAGDAPQAQARRRRRHGAGAGTAQMREAEVKFVCRYLAYLPNSKVINKTEADNLRAAGISVVLVWEHTGSDCDRGYADGHADAREAQKQANALGMGPAVIYFAPADIDAAPGDQARINAYFDGVSGDVLDVHGSPWLRR